MGNTKRFLVFAVAALGGLAAPVAAVADLLSSPAVEASPTSPIRNKVKDDELSVFINGTNAGVNGQKYGLTNWTKRTIDALLDHPPFRAKVEQLLVELLDDPETPWHDPLLDTQIELPLFGLFNVGLHFQDIWSGTGTDLGPWIYPNSMVPPYNAACTAGTTCAASRFADPATSYSPLTINWNSVYATISIAGGTMAEAANMPLTTVVTPTFADGSLNIALTLGDVYLDTILRKPDFPADPTTTSSGNYIHALGRLRIKGPTTLSVKVYSIGGKFAGSGGGALGFISGGYGIGIDFMGLTFSGGLQLDLDEFDCRYQGGNTPGNPADTLTAYQWARDDTGMCYTLSDHTTTIGGGQMTGGSPLVAGWPVITGSLANLDTPPVNTPYYCNASNVLMDSQATASLLDDAAVPSITTFPAGAARPVKCYVDLIGGTGNIHPDFEITECDLNADSRCSWIEAGGAHVNKTNERSDYIAEIIQFLEGQVFLDMQQNSLPASIKNYLTALEITDTTWMTHERDADSIINPVVIEHPIQTGSNMLLDYGFFYRFAGIDQANDGAFLPGGFAAAITSYTNPLPHCAGAVPGTGVGGQTAKLNGHGRIEFSSLWTHGQNSMIGLSVHTDPINRLLENVWRSKLLCMNLYSGSGMVGDLLTDILNVNQFSMFMPSLKTSLGNNEMAIRLKPRYTKPSTPAAFTMANDQPQITWEPGDPINMLNAASTGLWDIKIALPHIETIFAADTNGLNNVNTFTDIFSADVSIHTYLDLAWYNIVDSTPLTPTVNENWNATQTATVCKTWPYPCRIARVGFHLDAWVNEIDQASFVNRGLAINPADLTGSLSSLLALVMAGDYEGNLEVHINTDPTNVSFLGVVIEPSTTLGTNGFDRGFGGVNSDGESATVANDYFGGYFAIADLSGADPDGAGPLVDGPDGFSDTLDPQMLTDLLTDFGVLPAAPGFDHPVGYNPFARYGQNPNAVARVAPETMVRMVDDLGVVMIGTSMDLNAAQTKAMGIGARGGSIYLASDSVETAPENLFVQYKIDKGMFSLPMRTDRIDLPYQFDGRHTMQVWAADERGYLDATPAVIKYVVDTQAPRLKWVGDASVRADSYRRELSIRDAVSSVDTITLSYRVDGGNWLPMAGAQEVYIDSLGDGSHAIEVRAIDESGNESVLSDAIVVAEGQGFGCSASGATGSSTLSFVMMLLIVCAGYTGLRWRKSTV